MLISKLLPEGQELTGTLPRTEVGPEPFLHFPSALMAPEAIPQPCALPQPCRCGRHTQATQRTLLDCLALVAGQASIPGSHGTVTIAKIALGTTHRAD